MFLGLAGISLDRAFVKSAEETLENRMKSQVFGFLSVLEVSPTGRYIIPELLPEARLMQLSSGLHAFILEPTGEVAWHSQSFTDQDYPPEIFGLASSVRFSRTSESFYGPFQYNLPINWETEEGSEHYFTFVLHEKGDQFASSIHQHRKNIMLWLGLVGALMLVSLMLILLWSLAPLNRVRQEIDLVERGQQDGISGRYPAEIHQLSERINLFIRNERANLIRYKNTLTDLAHSLKTPLSVIQGMAESDQSIRSKDLAEYVGQMRDIVNYQLNRAATTRVSLMYRQIEVEPLITRVFRSLKKVYVDRNLWLQYRVVPDACFYGEESDLMEILGNLLDNACKWAISSVRCVVTELEAENSKSRGVRIIIEDDGPGIALADREGVLKRGVRADQRVEGQGIGLAVCQEIVETYDGRLLIDDSSLGGTAITVELMHPLKQ